ncbi:MAG TPA: hypothetical protein V6D30_11495 [Leptolyngbyaceae cyanobacterium]
MYRRKWIGWLIGTSLVSSGLSTLPASAVPPNQSDITGTNIWNNTAPIFENGGELSPEILNNARRLSQELEDASAGCCNASAPVEPRRFARRPGNPNEVCLSPDCQRLDSLVEETRVFLDDVNRSQAQQVRANRNRTW